MIAFRDLVEIFGFTSYAYFQLIPHCSSSSSGFS